MAATSSPAPGDGPPTLRSSPSPSVPIPPAPIPDFNGKIPKDLNAEPISELPHGGTGRVANLGSGGSGMCIDGVGRVGVQEYIDGGDPNMGTNGGGQKRQQCKNQVVPEQKRRKMVSKNLQTVDIRPIPHNFGPDPKMSTDGSGRKRKQCKNLVTERKKRKIISKGHLPIGSKSASPRVRSPTQVVTSPGVNILVRSAALRRAQQSPSCTMTSPTQVVSPSLMDLSPGTRTTNSHASNRRRRKLTSSIWREAEPIYKDWRLVEGRCIHCRQVFPANRDSGTSHIKQHLKVCQAKIAMREMVEKMGPAQGIDPNWKYDPNVARRKLVKLIVVNEMPFSLVEYPSFRQFINALNPWFEHVSRTTIKNNCVDVFKEHAKVMKEYFENCDSWISLTGDMWTSNQKLGYFCMTCHFISDEWVLHKRILRFCMLETPHNSLNMFNVVLDSIQEWNLEDKLFSFTLDNASVNTAMINLLRENLKNKGFLFSKGKLLHFRCATHVFNIIVQDGLREIKDVVSNIRESVKYIKSLQTRIEKFLGIIIQEGLGSRYKNPPIDVTTRWNSTYLMLDDALTLRSAFSSLEKNDKDYTFAPSLSEWELAEVVCKLFEVLYTATLTLSGSKYPTSHLYFHQLWNIKKMLNKEESSLNRKILNKKGSSQDIIISRMIKQMQLKFNQYWKESYKSACIPVILDPRFKCDLLEYLLIDFGSEEEAGTWFGEVKKTMQKLFDEYSKEVYVESQRESGTPDAQKVVDEDDPLVGWDTYMRSKRRRSSNELDRYLKEELVPRKDEIDILEWWKVSSSQYPVISKMARDILAIPASTVPSESAFSTGGRVVSDYRSSLACSTVETLICLQDWFKEADALKYE